MQNSLPKLNFPAINLRLRRSEGSIQLFDQLRRIYIVLTPEEWVRRHLIALLIERLSVPPAQIVLEYPVPLNGQRQRADLVVVANDGSPRLLCECKAADVKISQSTLDQAVRYNSVLQARYLFLTNGLNHYLYERLDNEGGYRSLSSLDEVEI
ncbi:MAG: type I restriction enzyme HsdR N-terminal domain-containing protein [Rikenellaceae bacterium]